MKPSKRLDELGIDLPPVVQPVGVYVPAVRVGDRVLTSGQLPIRDGKLLYKGKVPIDVPLEDAREAAKIAALNALAAAASAAGGIDHITRVVRLCVYVNSEKGFSDQPKVANGASEVLGEIFGEAGRHARSAVGAAELPMNAAVEIELEVQVNEE